MSLGVGYRGFFSSIDDSERMANFREEAAVRSEELNRLWKVLRECAAELLEVIRRIVMAIGDFAERCGFLCLGAFGRHLADISILEGTVELPTFDPLPPKPHIFEEAISLHPDGENVTHVGNADPLLEIRGIANIGNSCYCSATLQALIASSIFRKLITQPIVKGAYESEEAFNQRSSMLELLQKFYDNYTAKNSKFWNAIVMRDFLNTLEKSGLSNDLSTHVGGQQDAAGFLMLILDLLNMRFPLPTAITFKYFNEENKWVEGVSSSSDFACLLPIPLRSGQSFQKNLEEFFAEEVHVDDLENVYVNTDLKKRIANWKKGFSLDHDNLPELLPIQLKRFDSFGRKLFDRVAFPENDIITLFSGTYRLRAVIEHRGSDNSGHYVAYVRQEEQWILCSDSRVRTVESSEVHREEGYIYLFEREP